MDGPCVIKVRALSSHVLQVHESDSSRAGECEGGGRELGLFGEEEDHGAILPSVGLGDVEVEDCGDGGRDGGEVLRSGCSRGVRGVDGDDKMWELIFAIKVRLAGRCC